MNKIVNFLKKNNIGFLATIDQGHPRVRAFGFGFYENGKFYFSTNKTKKVSRQLKECSFVEFAVSSPDYSWNLRLSGHVVFDNRIETKKRIFEAMPELEGIYGSYDNPIFEVFYIEKGVAELSPFPPNIPPYVTKF